MIYIVEENYGHQYESNYTNLVGYCTSLEEAESKAEELEQAYALDQQLRDKYDEVYDELYEKLQPETDEEFDKFILELNALGYEEQNPEYGYDYYYVEVREVKAFEKTSNNQRD